MGTKVTVQLMYTDPNIRTRKQIVKSSEKPGLYLALDIADAADQSSGRVRRFKTGSSQPEFNSQIGNKEF